MTSPEPEDKQIGRRRWSRFSFDILLPLFLVVGWSLIFTTATLGLQSIEEQWLPVGLISEIAGDYTVKASTEPRLARINPEVIEAVKRDQILLATPTPTALAATATITSEQIVTPTLLGSWQVIIGGPYSGQEGIEIPLTAELTGSMLNQLPGLVSYIWDLDNDGQFDDANGASTSVAFYDEGVYTIGVQATDLLGQVDMAVTTISVSNVSPLVNIGQQNILTVEGQEVTFAAVISDPGHDVLLYTWDFGDNSPEVTDTLTPRHVYDDNGDYTVRIIAWDNDGGEAEATVLVKVDNLPPEVEAGQDQQVNEGDEVTFKGIATDAGILDPLTYDWDFNYDGMEFTTDASGATASTTYPNGPGNVAVALRVRDKDGGETLDTLNVAVINVPPVITSIADDGPVGEGSPLALTVTATDVGKADKLSYAFDWNNDGSFDEAGASNSASHTWDNQANYAVRVRVEDGDGGQVFATKMISTFNEPPVAVASAAGTALEGSALAFDASDSYDPGLKDALTYQWNFGDGKSGSGVSPAHIYSDNGVYSATLTVSDDSGATATAGVGVTILNANPVVDAGADLTVNEGTNVSLAYQGIATDPGAGDTLSYAWDLDYKDNIFDTDATGASGTKLYPLVDGPAEYTLALRVRDDDYPFPTSGGGQVGEAFDTAKVTVNNLPPWKVNAGGPYSGKEGDTITLLATAEDAPGDLPTLEYAWDLDDNPNFETVGRQVTKIWMRSAAYMVRLRVRDKDGGEGFASALVEIGNALPSVTLASSPVTPTVLLPVTFVANGSDPTNDPLSYQWNFGDGSPLVITTTSTLSHTYADDRVYTATIQVDDSRGGQAAASTFVTIVNLPPVAVASAAPTPVVKGNPVTFDAAGSSDPDDPPPPGALTYQWSFGDGNIAPGSTVSYIYPHGGTYTATLTVTDDNGAVGAASVPITVSNNPPTAAITSTITTTNEGGAITFDGSGSSDPNGDPLSYRWDFGDGSTIITTATPTTTHIYQNGPATYNATLTVIDNDGASSSPAALLVSVNNAPPAAVITGVTPDPVNEGSPVTFDASGSSDPGADTLTYTWDFGDGSPPVSTASAVTTHTYANGSATPYSVTLTVTDSDGDSSIPVTVQIAVNNVAPTANASATPNPVDEGSPVTFDASGSSDPGADTLTYTWDFGDGSPPVSTASAITIHTYANGSATPYSVTLTVTDSDGATGSVTLTVTVNNIPPTADAGADQTVNEGDVVTFSGSGSDVNGGSITGYDWDFDYDGITFGIDDNSGPNPTTSYPDGPRTVTVALRVTDNDGASSIDTLTVTVNNLAPQNASAGGPYTTTAGTPVQLNGSATDSDALTYNWDLDNNGTFEVSGNPVQFDQSIAGIYTVVLQVLDNDGGVATVQTTVDVQ